VNAPFDLGEYRRERSARLERENEHLRDERIRLERLLGLACRAAVAGSDVSESAFLGVLCGLAGTDPSRPAFIERREREEAEARMAHVVEVLRETA
jgi:hypothetical protein